MVCLVNKKQQYLEMYKIALTWNAPLVYLCESGTRCPLSEIHEKLLSVTNILFPKYVSEKPPRIFLITSCSWEPRWQWVQSGWFSRMFRRRRPCTPLYIPLTFILIPSGGATHCSQYLCMLGEITMSVSPFHCTSGPHPYSYQSSSPRLKGNGVFNSWKLIHFGRLVAKKTAPIFQTPCDYDFAATHFKTGHNLFSDPLNLGCSRDLFQPKKRSVKLTPSYFQAKVSKGLLCFLSLSEPWHCHENKPQAGLLEDERLHGARKSQPHCPGLESRYVRKPSKNQ